MPFLWNVLATDGVLIGNRDLGSQMQVTNGYWFFVSRLQRVVNG